MNRMNRIHGFDNTYNIVRTDAGVILENLMEYLKPFGYMPPVDLGARGSCHIGGNLATNAGGMKFLKYNSMHANTIGLKAVLADGTILDDMKCLRKDNTGYDLKQLFIGSEGTLGIITEAAILCPKIPSDSNVALLACNSFEDVTKILVKAKEILGTNLSAIEYFDNACNRVVSSVLKITNPLGDDHRFYVLTEASDYGLPTPVASSDDQPASGEQGNLVEEKLFALFDSISDLIVDGVVAQDSSQTNAIWKTREGIAEGFVKYGTTFKYDLSLPINKFDVLVQEIRQKAGKYTVTGGYGHIGDGNIHINSSLKNHDEFGLSKRELYKKVEGIFEPWVFEKVAEYQGSISAEHGIGYLKAPYLA